MAGRALCQGQALGTGHAPGKLDEAITETVDRWAQYEAQVPGSEGKDTNTP